MSVTLSVARLAALALTFAQDPSAAPPDPSAAPPDPSAATPTDGDFAVSTRLTPDPSVIGDLLTYDVTVGYPAGHAINVPRGVDLSPLETVSVRELDPESTGEGLRKVIRFELQYFDVGEGRVPSFDLTRVGPGGEVETLRVPAHDFEVDALLANEADPELRPDDPAVSLKYPNEMAEVAIYASLAAVVLAALATWGFLAWRRREVAVVAPPPVPPHVLAYHELESLEASREPMLERGEFQDYYLRLTDIAKAYLEGRFGIDANDRTTDEIRRELMSRGQRISPLSADEVLRFLQDCDLVKFARFAPPLDEAREALLTVRGMVDRSRPVRPPPGDAAEAGEDPPRGGVDVPKPAARDRDQEVA